jgi:hypothetical protein
MRILVGPVFVFAVLLATASCAARVAPAAGQSAGETAEVSTVRAAAAAYNAHDADKVVAYYADDIKWFAVDGNGQSLEGDGREGVRAWLVGYFQSTPNVHSEMSDVMQNGQHVAFREHVTWTKRDGTKGGQSSIAVYEVAGGKIRRAWYYPAVRR